MGFRGKGGAVKGPYVGKRPGGSSGSLTEIPTFICFNFTHTDFQIAALTRSITLYSLPARGFKGRVVMRPTTQFAGTGITKYELAIGVSGDLQRYMLYQDVSVAVVDTLVFNGNGSDEVRNYGAAENILISARATGANLDQSTAGAVRCCLELAQMPTT